MNKTTKPTRDGYGEGLVLAGKADPRVVVLTADLAESTRAHLFQQAFPDRFIECGVAEQNMAGVAAGLAQEGKIPFISSYAVFSPGRNFDQIRVSICYNDANVKVVGGHTGLSVGPDGATHQALEDIAMMRVLPNMTVVVPCDAIEARKATIAIARLETPAYLRLTRPATPVITLETTPFELGRAITLREGRDLTIIGAGPILADALEAADALAADGINARVINMHTIKPIDRSAIVAAARETKGIVTVEEHQQTGGLGAAVCEVVAQEHPTRVARVGMDDQFGQSGESAELLSRFKMDRDAIVTAVRDLLAHDHA